VASAVRVSVTSDDALALLRDAPSLRAVVPSLGNDLQVKLGNRNVNVEINATTADFASVFRVRLAEGRFFTRGEDYARRRVAVAGADIPQGLETDPADLVGSEILIRGIPFEVVGVLERKGDQPGREDIDDTIYIPYRTGEYRIFGSDRLQGITVQLRHADSTEAALLDIERVLRREHRLRPDQPNDFRIRDRSTFLTARAEASATLGYLLAGIAAVSLIVGGIGIMNIMLVSVTERTREIGVRKALGATKREIMWQFLVEAATLTLVGGIVGMILGGAIAYTIGAVSPVPAYVPITSIIAALLLAAFTGILFGLYPASRAARLDPVEALRYE
jgi:putative ABC transport system permease protein